MKSDYVLNTWLNGTFTKIVVSVDTEEELLALKEQFEKELPYCPVVLITDCGLTEFHGIPTNTCLGIGPYISEDIDNITGNLPLL